MITVKKICGCCNLQLGTEVIAILGIIFSIITIIAKTVAFYQTRTDQGTILAEIGFTNIQLMWSLILFIGARQRKSVLVLVWIIGSMIGMILVLIATLIIFAMLVAQGALAIAFAVLNVMILILLFSFYIWICVYSFYEQLKTSASEMQSNV